MYVFLGLPSQLKPNIDLRCLSGGCHGQSSTMGPKLRPKLPTFGWVRDSMASRWATAMFGIFAIGISLLNQRYGSQLVTGRQLSQSQPNIVFIITDDQDVHLDSLDFLPYVKQHITDRGALYKRHYCTSAICCPARVSLWTGKMAHNTNVTDVFPPYGMLLFHSAVNVKLTYILKGVTQSL